MRVVILTSGRFGTAPRCLPELMKSDRIDVVSVILASGGVTPNRKKLIFRKLKKVARIGLFGALNGIRMRSWYGSGPTEDIESLCETHGIPFHQTEFINSDRTAELFTDADAELGLSLGNSYIAERIFSLPKMGMINVHGERLPEYQNGPSIIWPIYNNEKTTGFTIHEIDEKIDTGKILYKEEFPIEFHPALQDTVMQTTKLTGEKVPAALRYVCENFHELRNKAQPQTGGRSYMTPSFGEFLKMRKNNKALFEAQST